VHSPSFAHASRQVPSGPHTYPPQSAGVCTHVPDPSQLPIGVNVATEHEADPQGVDVDANAQAPEPSHAPVRPQGGLGAQRPCGSRASASTAAQRPSLPETLHAWQTAHEVDAQHTLSTHEGPPVHADPRARSVHPPWPSQVPVVPHVPWPESGHVFAGSRPPAWIAVHVPSVVGSAHETHVPAQAPAQHTPWAHTADWHSPPPEQNAPFGFLPQELPLQTLSGAQWASEVQAS
jgi:hypothetical protein